MSSLVALLCCCYVIVTSLLCHCYVTVTSLLCHCCDTVATLLCHCYAMLHYCYITVVSLLYHCYVIVMSLLLDRHWIGPISNNLFHQWGFAILLRRMHTLPTSTTFHHPHSHYINIHQSDGNDRGNSIKLNTMTPEIIASSFINIDKYL